MVPISVSSVRHSLSLIKHSGLQLYLPPHRQAESGRRYSHPSPPWYSQGPFPAWPTWRPLLFKSHWPADRWKSLRPTSHLPAHWSELTWQLVSVGDCRSWCPATSTPNTWIGTRGWPRDGWNSYVIRLTRTPVWSLDRTLQPPTHTTPPPLPTSWTSLWRRTCRPRCIWLRAPH